MNELAKYAKLFWLDTGPGFSLFRAAAVSALGFLMLFNAGLAKRILDTGCYFILGGVFLALLAAALEKKRGAAGRKFYYAASIAVLVLAAAVGIFYHGRLSSWAVGVLAVIFGGGMVAGLIVGFRKLDWVQRAVFLAGGVLSLVLGWLFISRKTGNFFENARFFGAYFLALGLLIVASTSWRKKV